MDVIQTIKERRSINFFETGQEIPDEKLKQLLELSNLAPSSFNLQPWEVVLVRDPSKKKILRKCAFNQAKVEDASAVFIILANPKAVEQNLSRVMNSWEELGYMKPEMRETYSDMIRNLYGSEESVQRKLFAAKNAALFAMNLMTAAKGLGLDTHPMDGFDEECVKKEFHIPREMLIPMLIAVGTLRHGTTLLPRALRRDLKEFIKLESYEKPS